VAYADGAKFSSSKALIEIVLGDELVTIDLEFDNFRISREEVVMKASQRPALFYRYENETLLLGSELKGLVPDGTALLGRGALLRHFAVLGSPTAIKLLSWFRGNFRYANETNRTQRWALTAMLLRDPRFSEATKALLLEADLGVENVYVDELDNRTLDQLTMFAEAWKGGDVLGAFDLVDMKEPDDLGIRLVHNSGYAGEEHVSLDEESSGTKVWFGAIGIILDSLARGSVLLADELDTSLHPSLVRQIIAMFQSPLSNPRGAQLITNSQDISLLENSVDSRLLGRDQIWLTNRSDDGKFSIEPLTSFSPRRGEAIQRRYLEGNYGGVPKQYNQDFIASIGSQISALDEGEFQDSI
jgi:hypothetical protein